MRILFATSNPAKLSELQGIASEHGYQVVGPKEFGVDNVEFDENGDTFEANALIKWRAYAKALGNQSVMLFADDSGLVIDALDGQPGVKSRRWKDGKTEMTDQELIDYCLEKMRDVPADKRTAHFKLAMAYGFSDQDPKVHFGNSDGVILEKPNMAAYSEGFPYRALFFVPQLGKMLHDVSLLPPEERSGYKLHREVALEKIFPEI